MKSANGEALDIIDLTSDSPLPVAFHDVAQRTRPSLTPPDHMTSNDDDDDHDDHGDDAPPPRGPPYRPGRIHAGYDPETLQLTQHLIPDEVWKCRGCILSPIEYDEHGNEIPERLTLKKRNALIKRRMRERFPTTEAHARPRARTTLESSRGNREHERQSPSPHAMDGAPFQKAGDAIAVASESDGDDEVPTPAALVPSTRATHARSAANGQAQAEITEIDLTGDYNPDEELQEESDLAEAIRLSLQHVDDADTEEGPFLSTPRLLPAHAQPPTVTLKPMTPSGRAATLSSTEDLRAISTDDDEHTLSPTPPSAAVDKTPAVETTLASSATVGFNLASLDRKTMEAERLSRLKRKREGDNPDPAPKAQRVDLEHDVVRSQKQQRPSFSTSRVVGKKPQSGEEFPSKIDESGAAKPPSTSSQDSTCKPATKTNCYPTGSTFKTFIAGFPSARTIDFATLIGSKSSLESCLLSSFIWDFDWLFPYFDTRRTKFQLVMHAKTQFQREQLKQDFQGVPNVRLCLPPMDGNVACMHSKLMLLFYNDEHETTMDGQAARDWQGRRCRIVVPTANLVGVDWGVGGVMENTVWLIDLPPATSRALPGSHQAVGAMPSTETTFQKALKDFLRAQTVPGDVIAKVDEFDFGETQNIGFVHSIGGVHSGDATTRTGIASLSRTICELGLATQHPVELDYVTSSVGSLNGEFMSSMYLAAQGDSSRGLTGGTGRPIAPGNQAPGRGESASAQVAWRGRFRLYFPSDATVRRSKGGGGHAGTICFSTKWWQNGRFPQSSMRDCVSAREGLLMHNKLLFARHSVASGTALGQATYLGWVYVGSANLSESAWGRVSHDRATKQPRLNCRNWECGIVIPVAGPGGEDPVQHGLDVFESTVPVPMRYPAEAVESGKPWTFLDCGS